jgi:hypothetical protein
LNRDGGQVYRQWPSVLTGCAPLIQGSCDFLGFELCVRNDAAHMQKTIHRAIGARVAGGGRTLKLFGTLPRDECGSKAMRLDVEQRFVIISSPSISDILDPAP